MINDQQSNPNKLSKERLWSKLHEKYQSTEILGQGTYGIVYKAELLESLNNDNGPLHVALKRTSLDSGMSHGIPDTALREIAILNDMKHPNIVETTEYSCNISRVYLVMELLDKDLKQFIRSLHTDKKKIPVETVREVMFKVLQGISYLHNQRIIHRDLKPHNILVTSDLKTVKLADFGLARAAHCPVKTLTHEVVTLWYRPPEILLGDCVYDYSVDIWSAGCILAELLMDSPIFDGESELDTLMKIFSKIGTPPASVWPPNAMQMRTAFPEFPPAKEGTFSEFYSRFVDEDDAKNAEDLILSMLRINPAERLVIGECINHPWFDSIRDAPEMSVYRKYHDPRLANVSSKEKNGNDDVLNAHTCLRDNIQESFVKLQSLPSNLQNYHIYNSTRKQLSAADQIGRDHLLLSLGGLNAEDVMMRLTRHETPPNGSITDGIPSAPETPNMMVKPNLSSAYDKKNDVADESHNTMMPTTKAMPLVSHTISETTTSLGTEGVTESLYRTPRPFVTPFLGSNHESNTSSMKHERATYDMTRPNTTYSHTAERRLSEIEEYDAGPSSKRSLSSLLTPANYNNNNNSHTGNGLTGGVIALTRRMSREIENVGSAISRGLSGVLHWQDNYGCSHTPSSKE